MLKMVVLNCIVSVTATIHGSDQLVIDYTVVNQGRQTVAMFNRLYDGFDAKGLPRVDVNFVGVVPEVDRAVVAKKLFPVPPDTFVERTYLPFVTLVKPGATFIERVVLELPLAPWHPYLSASEMQLPPPTQQLPLYFELGMFAISAEGLNTLGRTNTSIGQQYSLAAFTEDAQHVARVGPLPVKVTVRVPAAQKPRTVP